jgi:Type VI secretion system, TssN
MEKVITNELSKTLLLMGIGVSGLLALFIKLMIKMHGGVQQFRSATLIYLLILFLFFSVVAVTGRWSILKSQLTFYIFYQVYFLLLGIAHIFWMQHFLKWIDQGKLFWSELIFLITAGLLGSIGFVIVYRFFDQNGLEYNMVASIETFFIPWIVYQTFQKAIAIPTKMFKQWYYPIDIEIKEPDEKKLKHLLIISFEFQKQTTDTHYTNFRAKAPVDMELGELFYYFINDYNDRHPQSKIQYIDAAGEPHGWIFNKKANWYTMKIRNMDADKTIYKNGIRENDVIICSRRFNQANID